MISHRTFVLVYIFHNPDDKAKDLAVPVDDEISCLVWKDRLDGSIEISGIKHASAQIKTRSIPFAVFVQKSKRGSNSSQKAKWKNRFYINNFNSNQNLL
jgi:hypothetical protein